MRIFITVCKRHPGWLTLSALAALWEGAALAYPPVILPSPLETLQALLFIAQSGQLREQLPVSSLRLAGAFGLAFALGFGIVFDAEAETSPATAAIDSATASADSGMPRFRADHIRMLQQQIHRPAFPPERSEDHERQPSTHELE